LAIFREAKARGLTTVLGQIDPGVGHFEIVREVAARWPEFGPSLVEPPPRYYEDWREECRLADRIIVNSEWSRDLLDRAGIAAAKIEIVPLPYQADASAPEFHRQYPSAFTPSVHCGCCSSAASRRSRACRRCSNRWTC
jgi:glycosyltransferase involved in cell wall biosynthesis